MLIAKWFFKGPRAQIDRTLYKTEIQREVQNSPNLTVMAGAVGDFILGQCHNPDLDTMKQRCSGVILGNITVQYSTCSGNKDRYLPGKAVVFSCNLSKCG